MTSLAKWSLKSKYCALFIPSPNTITQHLSNSEIKTRKKLRENEAKKKVKEEEKKKKEEEKGPAKAKAVAEVELDPTQYTNNRKQYIQSIRDAG